MRSRRKHLNVISVTVFDRLGPRRRRMRMGRRGTEKVLYRDEVDED